MFSQSRQQFFSIYPLVNSILSIGTAGDGITTAYSGVIPYVPLLQNNVLFSSVDINGNGLTLQDVPLVGNSVNGDLKSIQTSNIVGTINYITGAFSFTFPVAPAVGEPVNSQTVPYVASLPQALLFFDEKFILRPVPDQPYKVTMEVYYRPTELLSMAQSPNLAEWWQYIAYGAAKKIFEDRMDLDSVQLILPEFSAQQSLIIRRTIVQQTEQRTSTIYTENTAGGYGPGWFYGGGSF
jgi:hypothetical protein